MTPTSPHSNVAQTARQNASSTAAAPTTREGAGDTPSTPEEAARKFEKVLVRQFTKLMTNDMFTSSLAGEGGGNWMESQRDRQREHVTDMITEQLVESNSLGFSEKLMKKWNTEEESGASEAPSPDALDDATDTPTLPTEGLSPPAPTPQNEPHIDHAA